MQRETFRIRYPYSKFWLIFWILIFFPIGLVLLCSHTQFVSNEEIRKVDYEGTRFWLFFWAIFFFPITILLFVFNSSFVHQKTI